MTIDKKRIEDEAQHFFAWPHPKHRDTVTLTSCVIFAGTIAEMARAEERERCAKIVEPGALEPWEARCGAEGIALMRDLAAAIRAGAFTPEFMQAQADEAPDLARGA